ncbi:hypothetical protein V8F33_001396 [Rhypophila sp. PSN 637]
MARNVATVERFGVFGALHMSLSWRILVLQGIRKRHPLRPRQITEPLDRPLSTDCDLYYAREIDYCNMPAQFDCRESINFLRVKSRHPERLRSSPSETRDHHGTCQKEKRRIQVLGTVHYKEVVPERLRDKRQRTSCRLRLSRPKYHVFLVGGKSRDKGEPSWLGWIVSAGWLRLQQDSRNLQSLGERDTGDQSSTEPANRARLLLDNWLCSVLDQEPACHHYDLADMIRARYRVLRITV